jgi:carbon storage regulator
MLVLSRKLGECLVFIVESKTVVVRVLEIRIGSQVKIGIEAPKEVIVYREEILRRGNERQSNYPDTK